MNKNIKALLNITAACLVLLLLLGAAGRMKTEDCLRLHVIANSDNAEDQLVKLKVRDAVLSFMGGMDAASLEEAEKNLLDGGDKLLSAVETTLDENGFSYGAELKLGSFQFPDRVYDGEFYPAGEYEALRIVLGNGEGHNWWCVMFPPLCVIETDQEKAEYNEDGTLVFKSFIYDFIKGIFGE